MIPTEIVSGNYAAELTKRIQFLRSAAALVRGLEHQAAAMDPDTPPDAPWETWESGHLASAFETITEAEALGTANAADEYLGLAEQSLVDALEEVIDFATMCIQS